MMGFWNVVAKDLQVGDEIRLATLGGEEYVTVLDVEPAGNCQVRVHLSWGQRWNVPNEMAWDLLASDEYLTMRR